MPQIEVRLADQNDLEVWDSVVQKSVHGTVYHTLPWLSAIENNYNYELYRAVACRGSDLVGIFPFFVVRKYGFSLLSSPPPRTAVQFLGPIYAGGNAPNGRKLESEWLEFIGAAVQFVSSNYKYGKLSLRAALPFGAARAFSWRGLFVQPSYTYVIPLERDLNDIKSSCSNVIRRSISKCPAQGYGFEMCAEEDVGRIYEQISDRYREQGLPPPYKRSYLDQLWTTISRARLVGFKLVKDGRYVTGMLCTIFNGTISFWSGLPRATMEGTYVNDYFHWKVIEWAQKQGLQAYDLVGANTENIAAYKMKFSPLLEEYYQITDEKLLGKVAYYLHRRFFH